MWEIGLVALIFEMTALSRKPPPVMKLGLSRKALMREFGFSTKLDVIV